MQEEQLGHDGVGDFVIDLRTEENNAILEQTAVNVHRPLFAAALLNHVGDQGHGRRLGIGLKGCGGG